MAYDVVISYSRRNREIADRLVEQLRQRGIVPWYDRLIKPGADWRDEIANAITGARIFLILFSAESNDSQELRKELAIADRHRLLIVPVRVENVEPKGMFEYELARRQWFDIFDDWQAGLPGVVDHIAEAVHALSPVDGMAPLEQAPRAAATTEPRRQPGTEQSHARVERLRDAPQSTAGISALRSFLVGDYILLALLVPTALFGFVAAVTARDDRLTDVGMISIMAVGPLWLVLQIVLARRAGAERSLARTAQIAAWIAAAMGVGAALHGLSGPTDYRPIASIFMIVAGLALLALLVPVVRRKNGAWFWIGPLVATGLILVGFLGAYSYSSYDYLTNQSTIKWPETETGQILNGLGLVLGNVVYGVDILWRRRRAKAGAFAQS